MGLARLEAHSAEMNQQEWLAGLIAYNFIRAVMVQAGRHPAATLRWISPSAWRRCSGAGWRHALCQSGMRCSHSWQRMLVLLGQVGSTQTRQASAQRTAPSSLPGPQLSRAQRQPRQRTSRAQTPTQMLVALGHRPALRGSWRRRTRTRQVGLDTVSGSVPSPAPAVAGSATGTAESHPHQQRGEAVLTDRALLWRLLRRGEWR